MQLNRLLDVNSILLNHSLPDHTFIILQLFLEPGRGFRQNKVLLVNSIAFSIEPNPFIPRIFNIVTHF